MTPVAATVPILMAEDDADDRFLAAKALKENHVPNPLVAVANGEELMDYLYRRGKFSSLASSPAPCFILLDLNMPRMDGREALRMIKGDKELRKIPVIILTTSRSPEDLNASYEVGANSYITKPSDFRELVRIVQSLQNYWLQVVELPPDKKGN